MCKAKVKGTITCMVPLGGLVRANTLNPCGLAMAVCGTLACNACLQVLLRGSPPIGQGYHTRGIAAWAQHCNSTAHGKVTL
jgi:hypothetical protein